MADVKNMKTRPKTDDQLKSDAMALAVRFARAFADTRELTPLVGGEDWQQQQQHTLAATIFSRGCV